MKMILGQKVGMISSFLVDGKIIAVTVISAEPNIVIENKLEEVNGYNATKIGYEITNEKNISKPEAGIFKKLKLPLMRHIREFKNVTGYKIGDKITVDTFSVGDHIDVQSTSKGKGFTGAIKRWNFKCGPKSHGAGYPHRYQGSISFGRGGSQGQRVMKGKKMSGHHGVFTTTMHNLLVVGVDSIKNILIIKGSIPGPKNALILIKETNKVKKHTKNIELINLTSQSSSSVNEVQGE